MKKISILALAFVLTMCVLTGCRRTDTNGTSSPSTTTTQPTSRPTLPPATNPPTTMPSSAATEPGMDDMLPGTEDTVDPTNGANQGAANGSGKGMTGF